MPVSQKILVGKKEIWTYLKITEKLLNRFIQHGNLPVSYIHGRYYAHADNLDLYFQKLTFNASELRDEVQEHQKTPSLKVMSTPFN